MAFGRVLGEPIIEQHTERLWWLVDGPIELRHEVIHPAFLQPQLDICIKLVVLAEPGNTGRT